MPDEGHHHLVSGAEPPVPYRSVPPTSGWHFRERGQVRFGVFDEAAPLAEPHQVSVLAVHGVVVAYHRLSAAEVAALEALVAGDPERPVALTPYDKLEPGQVALTAWNLRQLCEGVDETAVEAFIAAHAAADPDFAMSGQDHAEHPDEVGDGQAAAGGDRGGRADPAAVVAVVAVLAVLAIVGMMLLRSRSGGPGAASR